MALPRLKSFLVAVLLVSLGLTRLASLLLLLRRLQPLENPATPASKLLSFQEWKRHLLEHNAATNSPLLTSIEPLISSSYAKDLLVPSVPAAPPEKPALLLPLDSKIYKDKFNYALADCAATVVETNAQARSAAAILRENKDTYLLNECLAPAKYVVIELCQDILVRQVVVGNFEFFSSVSRLMRVLVSDAFPAKTWHHLGDFEANNVRDLQTFDIESPLIWARYLKLEVLSHYGNEFYCPISVVRVHGTTMMEDFKDELPYGTVDETVKPIVVGNSPALATPGGCSLLLPYLGLNDFLKDKSTGLCDANDPEGQLYSTESVPLGLGPGLTKTTQELVFKNILKRLNLLESNALLSLLYIEEQSRILSRAFSDLEQKLRATIEQLVSAVNDTVLSHVGLLKMILRQQQQELEASFRAQRNQQHVAAASTRRRLDQLTHELMLQQRFQWLNGAVVICLLVYVILTRDAGVDVVPPSVPAIAPYTPPLRPFPLFLVGSLRKSRNGRLRRVRKSFLSP